MGDSKWVNGCYLGQVDISESYLRVKKIPLDFEVTSKKSFTLNVPIEIYSNLLKDIDVNVYEVELAFFTPGGELMGESVKFGVKV